MAKNFEIQLKFTTGKTAQKLIKHLNNLAKAQDKLVASQKKINTKSAALIKTNRTLMHSEEKHRLTVVKQKKAIDKLNQSIHKQKLNNKALKQSINKTTVAQNRMRISTDGLQRNLGVIRNKLLLVTFAFGGVVTAIKKAIDTSAQFEAVKVRLNSMFGSVEKGTKAFETFNDIAATTPFTLQDVVEGGAALKAFGTNAEEMIKPTADLAAFMGVNATEAAQALGRAFAGGAGAADILRERGILQLVRDFKGIDDLTKLTLPEFRAALQDTLLDPASGIAGATDKLAQTTVGMMSNLSDSFTRMSAAFGDLINIRGQMTFLSKAFTTMKDFFVELNKTNLDKITELKEALGVSEEKDAVKESIEALELRIHLLKEALDPSRTLADAEKDLNTQLAQELLNRLAIEKLGKETFLNKEDIAGLENRIRHGQNLQTTFEAEIATMKSLAKAQEELRVINDNLAVSNRDMSNSFAEGMQRLVDIDNMFATSELSFRNIFPTGNALEDLVKKFGDDAAAAVEANEMTRLNDAFEASLEFDKMFQDQMVNGFAESMNQIISLQEQNLNARINNELKALKKTDKFRNASMEERQTMEDDIRAKFASEQKRIFKMQQAMQIRQVVMDTAADISALMTAAGAASFLDPTAMARAKAISIGMGAIAAAQIGTISKQEAPAFARGGSFTTQGEQFIKVGDNSGGRERVEITPLSSPDFGDAGGGSSINVNIMGNVIGTQEFVRDNLLPEIENSIRRNLA